MEITPDIADVERSPVLDFQFYDRSDFGVTAIFLEFLAYLQRESPPGLGLARHILTGNDEYFHGPTFSAVLRSLNITHTIEGQFL